MISESVQGFSNKRKSKCFSCLFAMYLKCFVGFRRPFPAGIYLLKVNNGNTRTICEICSKLTIKTPEQRQSRRYGVFMLTLGRFHNIGGIAKWYGKKTEPIFSLNGVWGRSC